MPKGQYPRKPRAMNGGAMPAKAPCDFPGCTNHRIGRAIYCRKHLDEQKQVQSARPARKALKGVSTAAVQVTPGADIMNGDRHAEGRPSTGQARSVVGLSSTDASAGVPVPVLGPVVADPEPSRRCAHCGLRRPLRLFDPTHEYPEFKLFNYVCRVCDGTFDASTEPLTMDAIVTQLNQAVGENVTFERQLIVLTRQRDQLAGDVRSRQALIDSQASALQEWAAAASSAPEPKPAPQAPAGRKRSAQHQAEHDELRRDYDVLLLQNERLTLENERLERALNEVRADRAVSGPDEPFVIAADDDSVNVLRNGSGRGQSQTEWIVMVGGKEVQRGQSTDRQQASDDGWAWVRAHRAESPQMIAQRTKAEQHPLDRTPVLPAETTEVTA